MTSTLRGFLSLLCGDYSNQEQAFDNPPLFAHIHLRYRPIEHLQPGSILLEQTYAVDPKNPYRLRMIRAEEKPNGVIKLWNHTFREPSRFNAATFDRALRGEIQESDLICLDECHYQVREVAGAYLGSLEPNCRCIVHRNGKDTVLVSTFKLEKNQLKTLDRGHDPVTNERCWGSIAGEFQFQKLTSWNSEIPADW